MTYKLDHPILTQEETLQLVRKVQEKDCEFAMECLVVHNLKLCHTVIKKTFPHLDADELIGDAILGLMRAIRQVDLTKTKYLSTYAWNAIKHALYSSDFIQPYLIGFPQDILEKRRAINACVQHLSNQGITEPTLDEINAVMRRFNEKEVQRGYNTLEVSVESLDTTVSDEDERALDNFIAVDGGFDEVDAKIDVDWFLSYLNEKDRDLIEKYYGIGCKAMSLRQIVDALPKEMRGRTVEMQRQNIKMIMTFFQRLAKLEDRDDIRANVEAWQTYRAKPYSRRPAWLNTYPDFRLKPEHKQTRRTPEHRLRLARQIRKLFRDGMRHIDIARKLKLDPPYVHAIVYNRILKEKE